MPTVVKTPIIQYEKCIRWQGQNAYSIVAKNAPTQEFPTIKTKMPHTRILILKENATSREQKIVRDNKRLWESEGPEQNTIISHTRIQQYQIRPIQQASDNIRDNVQMQMIVTTSIPAISRRQVITIKTISTMQLVVITDNFRNTIISISEIFRTSW